MRSSESSAIGVLILVEAVATGLAYGAGLTWASAALLAVYSPNRLALPYWHSLPHLRTDTSGVVAFAVVAVLLPLSEYLRLRRRRDIRGARETPQRNLFLLAVGETVAVLATGLVVYLSANSVTHPATLLIHATHFASWPTEGTLRVIALLLCVVSVSVWRYLYARPVSSAPRVSSAAVGDTVRL